MRIQKKFSTNNAICFATDNSYFKFLYVALSSLVMNSSKERFYDIVILTQDLSTHAKAHLSSFSSSNISIRFIEMTEVLTAEETKIFHVSGHISRATYFRFFIPEFFADYEKVVYLDCDIIFKADISDIFAIDIGENILGVVNDCFYQIFDKHFKNITTYIHNTLYMNEKYYFNAGIILYNIPKTIEFNLKQKCFDCLLRIKDPHFHDQDILNSITAGNNFFLPIVWNFQWGLIIQYAGHEQDIRHLPYYVEYYEALHDAKLIHYTTDRKPWTNPSLELAEEWWRYARNTPFYEAFLEMAMLGASLEERLCLIAPVKLGYKAALMFFKLLAALGFGAFRCRMEKHAMLAKKKLRYVQSLKKTAKRLMNI